MIRNEEITEKLLELIKLANEDKTETPLQIVLLAISGARSAGQDQMLAKVVQSYVLDVLLPMVKSKANEGKINLN